ncbi:MAG: carbonic anhydrase [bacterium]|nr:carbonic anhydrase [bacterium]
MPCTRRQLVHLLGLAALSAPGFVTGRSARADEICRNKGVEAASLWRRLTEGNRRFVAGTPAEHDLVRARRELLGTPAAPIVVLGCSDDRIAPETVFDTGLGELFVVRTAGNVVDPVGLGSIEYAVRRLGARLLVVLGHDRCGAVEAAMTGELTASPALEAIMRRIAPALEGVRSAADGSGDARPAIVANVRQSARDLVTYSRLVGDAVATGKLVVVQAFYRLETGTVDRLV